jgi:hypothetical protein
MEIKQRKTVKKENAEILKITPKQKKFLALMEEGRALGLRLYKEGKIGLYDKKAVR